MLKELCWEIGKVILFNISYIIGFFYPPFFCSYYSTFSKHPLNWWKPCWHIFNIQKSIFCEVNIVFEGKQIETNGLQVSCHQFLVIINFILLLISCKFCILCEVGLTYKKTKWNYKFPGPDFHIICTLLMSRWNILMLDWRTTSDSPGRKKSFI